MNRLRAFAVRSVDLVALYFPGLLIGSIGAAFYLFVVDPSPARFAVLCALPYVVPLALYRLVTFVAPIRIGGSRLQRGTWNSWFVAYRLQLIYSYVPWLEQILLSVPGLYSLWLRAWGSRIGKAVFWGGTVSVTDRGHVEIGDGTFFGNQVYLSAHVVRTKVRNGQSEGIVYLKPVVIGRGVFVGAGCRMGPGVVVEDGAQLPVLTDLYLNERFEGQSAATQKPRLEEAA